MQQRPLLLKQFMVCITHMQLRVISQRFRAFCSLVFKTAAVGCGQKPLFMIQITLTPCEPHVNVAAWLKT